MTVRRSLAIKQLDRGLAVILYLASYSARQVASKMGCPDLHKVIHKHVSSLGLTRTRAEAIRERHKDVIPSSHWRTARSQARKLWVQRNGPIPKGLHVHHRDHDYTNNAPENHELMTAGDHARHHHKKYPIARHLRPERQEYMRQYMARRKEAARAQKT